MLDDEMFERIQEYFMVYGRTSREISTMETQSCDKVLEQAEMVCIGPVKFLSVKLQLFSYPAI